MLLFALSHAYGQPFDVGSRSQEFYDADRDRTIGCTIHYPASVSGSEAPVAAGTFPVLVHGHGFVMTVDAYDNLRDGLVPRGYILVLPTTEGGFAPDHAAFGADLAFLAGALQAANAEPTSPFFAHVANSTALLGHSMGGGASMLAAASTNSVQAVVNFAAAETNPSAIDAASLIDVPTLMFAATEDCVTPATSAQRPMFDAISAPCKAFVNVVGGGHCYFAANSFTCSLGELTCGPDLTITREEQNDVIIDFAGLWLDHFLRGDGAALNAFRDSVALSDRVIAEHTCLTTAVEDKGVTEWSLAPVPAIDVLHILSPPSGAFFHLLDACGRILRSGVVPEGGLDVSALSNGPYRLVIRSGSKTGSRAFYVAR
ncbi:MAG: dienelactone hydrolase family protein [Flavobacteriales bacterium]|nr:dienelactone hydrolase family protein [Flavobacteriales bacterium]